MESERIDEKQRCGRSVADVAAVGLSADFSATADGSCLRVAISMHCQSVVERTATTDGRAEDCRGSFDGEKMRGRRGIGRCEMRSMDKIELAAARAHQPMVRGTKEGQRYGPGKRSCRRSNPANTAGDTFDRCGTRPVTEKSE